MGVDEMKVIHEAQLWICMRLSGIKQGCLNNLNVERLADGLKSNVL